MSSMSGFSFYLTYCMSSMSAMSLSNKRCPYSGESKCTLLSVAALKGNLEVQVEHLLLERGAIPDNTYYSTNEKKLWKAANEGNVEEVTRLQKVIDGH